MTLTVVHTNEFLEWFGKETAQRYRRRSEIMGKHNLPDTEDVFRYGGYRCEGCGGFWGALEPDGGDRPEELPCLATEGCEGLVVALYPPNEPPPDWVPIIIQGEKV